MGTEPSPTKQLAIFVIALGVVLALGGWVVAVVYFPRLGSSFDEQLPGARAEHLVIEQLRGVLEPRWELQLQVGYAEDRRTLWSTPLPAGANDVVLTSEIAILRTPRAPHDEPPQLEAYGYDDGALRWSLPDEHAATRPWVDEEHGLVFEAWGQPVRLRAIELETGRVRWELSDPSLQGAPASSWALRVEHDHVALVLARVVIRIGLADGRARHVEPEGSVAIAACGSIVASLSPEGAVRISPAVGGEPVEIGRARPGRLTCAEHGGRALIGWVSADGEDGHDPVRGPGIEDGSVPPSARGAVFAVSGAGTAAPHRDFAFSTLHDGPRHITLGPPCRVSFYDPYVSDTSFDVSEEVAPPPPAIAFDCASGAAQQATRW